MKKKLIGFLSLLCFSSSLLPAQQATSSAERIRRYAEELEAIQSEREILIGSLQTANDEQKKELAGKEKSLNEREQELNRQIAISKAFGDLIDDLTESTRRSGKKLAFWRITSAILAASLATSIIIQAANN